MRRSILALLVLSLLTTISLARVPEASAAWRYLPHITGEDADWSTLLLVDYNGALPAAFTLELFQNGVQIYNNQHPVSSAGTVVLDLKALAPGAQLGRIQFDAANLLSFRVAYEHLTGGGLAEFQAPDNLERTLGFLFSDYVSSVAWKGLAIANHSSSPTTVTLYAQGEGATLSTASLSIPAYSRVRGLYSAWFPALAFSQVKRIVAVSSSESLTGITISGDTASARLLFTTAQEIADFSSSYTDVNGTWSGMWESTDSPGYSGFLIARITESAGVVSGTVDAGNTGCGDIYGVPFTGSYDGTTLVLNGSYSCQGVTASLQYTSGNVNGNTISGTYSGVAGGSHYDGGTFSLNKE